MTQPDCRPPIELSSPNTNSVRVGMRWKGPHGTVLTGSESHFGVRIERVEGRNPVHGRLTFQMRLASRYSQLQANPVRQMEFVIDAEQDWTEVELPDEWLFVEGKAVYILTNAVISGKGDELYAVPAEHPLASLTVFERSTYSRQQRTSWATLILSGVAAFASVTAATAYIALR